jgi:hypothetical protein
MGGGDRVPPTGKELRGSCVVYRGGHDSHGARTSGATHRQVAGAAQRPQSALERLKTDWWTHRIKRHSRERNAQRLEAITNAGRCQSILERDRQSVPALIRIDPYHIGITQNVGRSPLPRQQMSEAMLSSFKSDLTDGSTAPRGLQARRDRLTGCVVGRPDMGYAILVEP